MHTFGFFQKRQDPNIEKKYLTFLKIGGSFFNGLVI